MGAPLERLTACILDRPRFAFCVGTPSKSLIDQTFGRWTVLSKPFGSGLKGYWVCACVCGTIRAVLGKRLRSGDARSCGTCVSPELIPTRLVLHSYRQDARKRGHVWTLSKADATLMMLLSCFHCGGRPKTPVRRGGKTFFRNGLDRLNNKLGYVPGNVVPCCRICNADKSDRDLAEFRSHTAKRAAFNQTKTRWGP